MKTKTWKFLKVKNLKATIHFFDKKKKQKAEVSTSKSDKGVWSQ